MDESKVKRQKKIILISILGIFVNILLAVMKLILGMLSGSIAIISDAVNNLTDSSSSFITIIGTKLAQKEPNQNHPFGYGRIEYLTDLLIGIIVLTTGVETAVNSIKGIFTPTKINYTAIMLLLLGVTIFIKIGLGVYTKKFGKQLQSGALVASGIDSLNDAAVSSVTIISAVIYLITGKSIDAYAGILISFFIIKAGLEVLHQTLGKIVGERVDRELTEKIELLIKKETNILGVHDLILNNYGPSAYIGSINVEISYEKTAGEIYLLLHRLQVEIFKRLHVYLVFGIYAINDESKIAKRVSEIFENFEQQQPSCMGYHGIVIDDKERQIFGDVILDFKCDREALKKDVSKKIEKEFPQYQVFVTVDTMFTEISN